MRSGSDFFADGTGVGVIQTQTARETSITNPDRLLERAMDLDSQALAQIHDRYYPAVYRYVRYRLNNEQVVEDIASDVFLRLLDHLHRRKGEIHDLRAWLMGTAANLVSDHLRQKYRRPTEALDDQETLDTGEDLHRITEENENQAAVRKAMRELTLEQQHVLALRFSQGYSVEQTANVMNKTIGAVKVLQFRALGALRKLLSARG